MAHLSETDLEEYAMGRLTKEQAQLVGEHVQTCQECRDRLTVEIGIAVALRAAKTGSTAEPQ